MSTKYVNGRNTAKISNGTHMYGLCVKCTIPNNSIVTADVKVMFVIEFFIRYYLQLPIGKTVTILLRKIYTISASNNSDAYGASSDFLPHSYFAKYNKRRFRNATAALTMPIVPSTSTSPTMQPPVAISRYEGQQSLSLSILIWLIVLAQ